MRDLDLFCKTLLGGALNLVEIEMAPVHMVWLMCNQSSQKQMLTLLSNRTIDSWKADVAPRARGVDWNKVGEVKQ